MLDIKTTTKRLLARALSTAPSDRPWAWVSAPSGDNILVYRTSDDPSDPLQAVSLTQDENAADVYRNIASGHDTRRPMSTEYAKEIFGSGACIIESPTLSMFYLEADSMPARLAVFTPDSAIHIPVGSTSARAVEGFDRERLRDELAFMTK